MTNFFLREEFSFALLETFFETSYKFCFPKPARTFFEKMMSKKADFGKYT